MSKKKKELLTPDWVERDEDFVHRSGPRSGWDKSSRSTSEYLYGEKAPRSAEKQIKEIYQLCRYRARNLSTNPIHLSFSHKEETGRTDGKRVFVSTGVLDEKKSFAEKADIMLGITTHEMGHVMHTDFGLVKKSIKNTFHHSLWNVVEDEMLERKIGEEFPGYANNLSDVKKYFFEEKYLVERALKAGKKIEPLPERDEEEEEEEEDEDIEWMTKPELPEDPTGTPLSEEEKKAYELFDLVFKFVRYPAFIDEETVGKYETEMDDIKEILKDYPRNTAESIAASHSIATIIKKSLEEDMDPSKADSILDKLGASAGASMSSDNEDPASGPREESESTKYDYQDVHIEDEEWNAVFRKGEARQYEYSMYLKDVIGDAKRLANVLQTRVFNETKHLKGMRSGVLDDNRIVEAANGVKTVHSQRIEKVGKEINMAVLIDESGSMGCDSNYRNAAKAAILLEKAYDIFPVGQLFIYGFTSDHDEDFNTVIRYREPGLNVRFGLGDVQPRSNNRDGHAIRAVAKRIRTFTQKPMIYFIISDGQPSAGSYYGYTDTRNAVKDVTKMKFYPVQIGIGMGITPDQQKQMFDEFIHYDTSRQMVENIRKLLVKTAHKHMGI